MLFEEKTEVQLFLKIHPYDNVLVALRDITAGTVILFENEELILKQDIGAKHKFFINDMSAGENVIMYGTLVGKVQSNVSRGGLFLLCHRLARIHETSGL